MIRVLINRTDAIGDLLLTLPMAMALKESKKFNVEVAMIVTPLTAPLLEGLNFVDQLYIYHKKGFFKDLRFFWAIFKKWRPQEYYYVGGSHLASLCACLSSTPVRGGLLSRLESFFFLNRGVRQKRSLAQTSELHYNLALLKHSVLKPVFDKKLIRPFLKISENEKQQAIGTLPLLFPDLKNVSIKSFKLIMIHPGMKGHTLNWPMLYYAQLIESLLSFDHYRVIVSYTPVDTPYIDELKAHLAALSFSYSHHLVFYNGQEKGLRSYLALQHQCDLFIGPSTGTLHMAAALGVRWLAFYSPVKVQSFVRWRPLEETQGEVLIPQVDCPGVKKCLFQECSQHPCMQQVTVQQAFDKITELSKNKEGNS